MEEVKTSAFVVCCNEEQKIERCLQSLAWCDEVIIVDSGSTDNTLLIARKFTSKIYHRRWSGFVEQKRYALGLCRGEWVLNVDADEVVSEELRDEITGMLQSGELERADGYELQRTVFFQGRFWRRGGWYPEYRLRLCRRSKTSWGGSEPHEKAVVAGRTMRLRGELLHYSFSDFAALSKTLNGHSSSSAQTMRLAGKRFTLLSLFGNPLARFIKFYLLKRGFLEGVPGFVAAVCEANAVMLKYAKLWELEQQELRRLERQDETAKDDGGSQTSLPPH